jgi:hypothetical protein
MMRSALADVEDGQEQYRLVRGVFDIAVYGRSVTLALQKFGHWDEAGFDAWYAPRRAEMNADPLCRFFYVLRTEILHGVTPVTGYVLASFGADAPPVGTITFLDREVPTEHGGTPIADTATVNLCRLYFQYLERLFDAAHPMIFAEDAEVQAAWFAAHVDEHGAYHE